MHLTPSRKGRKENRKPLISRKDAKHAKKVNTKGVVWPSANATAQGSTSKTIFLTQRPQRKPKINYLTQSRKARKEGQHLMIYFGLRPMQSFQFLDCVKSEIEMAIQSSSWRALRLCVRL